MDIADLIDFAKVGYHLFLDETLEEWEFVEYLWDADCEVDYLGDKEVTISYLEDNTILTFITITQDLDVRVESNFNDFE